MFKVDKPFCAECGGPATYSVDLVYCRAPLKLIRGELVFDGEAKVLWETQHASVSVDEMCMLGCDGGHEWLAVEIMPTADITVTKAAAVYNV